MNRLYVLLFDGKQKAVAGFLTSGILSALALWNVNERMTVKEVAGALAVAVVTHLSVWLKSNVRR